MRREHLKARLLFCIRFQRNISLSRIFNLTSRVCTRFVRYNEPTCTSVRNNATNIILCLAVIVRANNVRVIATFFFLAKQTAVAPPVRDKRTDSVA